MVKKMYVYLRPYKKVVIFGCLCSAFEAVFELLIPLVMANIVDVGIRNTDIQYTVRNGFLMIGMAAVALLFGLGAARLAAMAGQSFGAAIREAEYARIQEYSFRNIEHFTTASLITRLTGDVRTIQMVVTMGMRILVRAPVMLVCALALTVFISIRLASVFLVSIPVLAICVWMIVMRARVRFDALQKSTDALNVTVQENLIGMRVVKSFVRESSEKEKFALANKNLMAAAERAYGLVVMSMPIMLLVMFSTTIAVMWLGGKSVAAGTLMVGQLSGFLTYVSQILMALMMLSMVLMMLSRSVASVRRVIEVIEEEPDITDENADRGLAVADGSVRFEDVWFKYNDTSPEWNLSGVDLSIRSGQTVGVIGATGSGKTTLVQLIARLYDTTKGRVLVGGRDVRDYDIHTLRSAVAMVLQNNTLFSGTIRENLRWGKSDATQEEMDEACRSACADEFIARFADGYETDLGQGGVNLSGGQKQRLCIARALLKKPKVLILDDSTSAVDMSTDAKIRHALRTALAETTKIIIAQRIASVSDADLIVVLDEGRVSAAGTHDELMKTSEIYRDVYLSQSEGVGLNG